MLQPTAISWILNMEISAELYGLQVIQTGPLCSGQQYRSHLGRSACPHTQGSAGLGGLIWRSRPRRWRRGLTQAIAGWQGVPRRDS